MALQYKEPVFNNSQVTTSNFTTSRYWRCTGPYFTKTKFMRKSQKLQFLRIFIFSFQKTQNFQENSQFLHWIFFRCFTKNSHFSSLRISQEFSVCEIGPWSIFETTWKYKQWILSCWLVNWPNAPKRSIAVSKRTSLKKMIAESKSAQFFYKLALW